MARRSRGTRTRKESHESVIVLTQAPPRPLRWLLWACGIDTRSKVVALVFTVLVSMILRNELVILIARAGLSEPVTRVLVYGIGWVTYVAGAHFNHWVFRREW